MFKFKKSAAALAVTACLGVSLPALANNTNGAITGNSVTTSGNVLTGVTVSIENLDTGLSRTVVSNDDGAFRFPLLPPGPYKIVAEKDGFTTTVEESVRVGISGKVNLNLALNDASMERIEVSGSAISLVDITSNSTGIVVDSVTLEKVPVPRDLTSVALLAPGTTKGDSNFGNVPSIGGASAAENAYYVNGLNLTNFRTGVGSSNPPFEMFDTFEVKTGGYSAEYGRVTGGVINAKTKSGTNDFKWGVNVFIEPDGLREDKPNAVNALGQTNIDNSGDENTAWDVNLWASGAIVEDTLFFYVLYNPRSDVFDYLGRENQVGDDLVRSVFKDEDEDAFWGAKIDWYINENNILEVTGFSDKSDELNYTYTSTNGVLDEGVYGTTQTGGDNYSIKYTSILTDDFSISAMYGINEANRTTSSPLDANPAIYRRFDSTGAFVRGGNFGNFNIDVGSDEREVFRIDADWYIGDHEIRFGVDSETLTATANTTNSGGNYYLIYVDDVTDPANPTPYEVRRRTYIAGGDFESKNFAYYIQDQWQATDKLVINAGLRNDSFENFNGAGESFIELSNQWALRLGAVYDVNGDGDSKAYFSYGRYYLPIAANTNIRLSGAETYIHDFRAFEGFADASIDLPNFNDSGTATSPQQVFSDGDVPTTAAIVDQSIDPMYSDEYIAGYQFQLSDDWSMAVQGTYRELATTIEDVAIDYGFNQYLEREFGRSCEECSGFHYYILTNPGTDLTFQADDGETYTIPADDLNYPESIRKYASVDVTFERAWDGVWMLNAAYTWSHSWGNNEGYIRSDNGQDDAGLTTLFDQPGLLDGANGNLPNDRRHAIKLFGSYQVTEELNLGINAKWQSGRPKNAFGYHPTDVFAQAYGSESFFADGELVPRGSLGTTSSVLEIDVTASYNVPIGEDYDLTLRADIFNILNSDTATEVAEIYDQETSAGAGTGLVSPEFGLPSNWQTPRFVRLSASLRF
ncbi:TonB-dependent receptor [Paraglaciecola arctica]|uniref:TonB-dependent receptor n=1 Tax=Paraglaciecola arctica TaxID=1128911 RepID=UPI001C07063B|nr:TonB-dependent receptor [Paraglaciecola arctica]MBU3003304.1 TonB-dependent receptor [Paraglaciecola arctica]